MPLLEVRELRKSFEGAGEVLKGISFSVEKGEVIAILGPSGGGKTTLLRCINFLERAESGTLIFDGRPVDLASANEKEIRSIRLRTGFVFQNYNLFLNRTALGNVTEGLVTGRGQDRKEAEKTGLLMLDKVGLADRADAYPNQLSGGQQQRVAIARALAAHPDIIYFDEPTSALDPDLTGEVLAVMRQLAEEGMTMLVVTHELGFARSAASRIIRIGDGRIEKECPAGEYFKD